MRTRSHVILLVSTILLALGATAHAQTPNASPSFRIDVRPREFARAPTLDGYVHNDGLYRITNVRLRVDVIDGNGAVMENAMGWVVGDISAGSRGYFMVPLTRMGSAYRVTVVSFDLVAQGP